LGADGADDGVTTDLLGAAFDDPVKAQTKVFAAERKEIEGVSVAVEGDFRNVVLANDRCRDAPHEEIAFDLFAVGMVADLAFAAVALLGGQRAEIFFVFRFIGWASLFEAGDAAGRLREGLRASGVVIFLNLLSYVGFLVGFFFRRDIDELYVYCSRW
jgi:hypothetical protein